jgi:hypothetical protein
MSKELVLSLDQGRVTQTEVWAAPNFSFEQINLDETITIPQEQQMLFTGPMKLNGCLSVFGEVINLDLIDDDTPPPPPVVLPGDNYSHRRIEALEEKIIPQNQQMILSGSLELNGSLRLLGETVLIQSNQSFDSPDPVLFEDNHSYKTILAFEKKAVPRNQQMPLFGGIKLEGSLSVFGEVVMASPYLDEIDDYLPPFIIEAQEIYKVAKNRLMQLPIYLTLNGNLKLNGFLMLGA